MEERCAGGWQEKIGRKLYDSKTESREHKNRRCKKAQAQWDE